MTTYSASGVDPERGADGLGALLSWVRKTESHRPAIGRSVLGVGYFAAVLDLGGGKGLAIGADGVGTKILVAQMANRFDTVGIDCVAMNVNDLICVGAEPIALVDYLAIADPEPSMMEALGRGLYEGARQAGISIPGGEMAQVPAMLSGPRKGAEFDLVATAVGIVDLDRVNTGSQVTPGDVIVGIASSGLHSNGYSLVRKVLLQPGSGLDLDTVVPELGRSLADELLEPTIIYVDLVQRIAAAGIEPSALINITGDGLLNLLRVEAEVTFRIDRHPEPPPIFDLIQRLGNVSDEEMLRTFNLGVGFAVIAAPDAADRVVALAGEAGLTAWPIGTVEAGSRQVRIERWGLTGSNGRFERTSTE